jgi:hypothetical protein
VLNVLLGKLVFGGCKVELGCWTLIGLLWRLGCVVGDDCGLVDFVCDRRNGQLLSFNSGLLCYFGSRRLDSSRSGLLGRLDGLCGRLGRGRLGLGCKHAGPRLLRSYYGVLCGFDGVVEHL